MSFKYSLYTSILITASALVLAYCQKNYNQNDPYLKSSTKHLREKLKPHINTQERIETIRTIGSKRIVSLKNDIVNILTKQHPNNQFKELKYVAATTLSKLLEHDELIPYFKQFISYDNHIMNIVALQLIQDIVIRHNKNMTRNTPGEPIIAKNNIIYIGENSTRIIQNQSQKLKPDTLILAKAAKVIANLNYSNAYFTLLTLITKKNILLEEIIIALCIIKPKNQNQQLKQLLASLKNYDGPYKRYVRKALVKATFVLKNKNNYFIHQDLIEMLAELGSHVFKTSADAENYFKLFNPPNYQELEIAFGDPYTKDPKKINMIINNRIPLLKTALKSNNKQILFKTLKIIDYIKANKMCSDIKSTYKTSSDKDIKLLALHTLANVNCQNITKFLLKQDSKKNIGSPFFIHLTKNKRLTNKFLKQYPILFSQPELIPLDLTKNIDYNIKNLEKLLFHKNKTVRLYALYSVYISKFIFKKQLLQNVYKVETDKDIKLILDEMIK